MDEDPSTVELLVGARGFNDGYDSNGRVYYIKLVNKNVVSHSYISGGESYEGLGRSIIQSDIINEYGTKTIFVGGSETISTVKIFSNGTFASKVTIDLPDSFYYYSDYSKLKSLSFLSYNNTSKNINFLISETSNHHLRKMTMSQDSLEISSFREGTFYAHCVYAKNNRTIVFLATDDSIDAYNIAHENMNLLGSYSHKNILGVTNSEFVRIYSMSIKVVNETSFLMFSSPERGTSSFQRSGFFQIINIYGDYI